MAYFASYARQDHDAVRALKNDLERLGRTVWIDEKLHGGQDWWQEILGQIRACEVFVWTVSPASVRSKACKSELDYALALGRPVLPVMIKPVALSLAPQRIANAQVIDYTVRDADQVIKLAGDLNAMPAPAPLPNPLPPPPPVPISYLEPFADEINAPRQLPAPRQREMLDFLRPLATSADDAEDAEASRGLLSKLRHRSDVTFEVATAIDQVLSRPPQPTSSSPPQAPPFQPHAPQAAPSWAPPAESSRGAWGAGPQWQQPAPAAGGGPQWQQPALHAGGSPQWQQPAVRAGTAPWSDGAFIGLIAATFFCGGIVGIIAGLMGRADPAKRSQATTLLWLGVITLASYMIGTVVLSASEVACDPTVQFC